MKADKKILEKVKNRLVKAYNPLAIYLFGSHAWGEPDKDSDLDLLVVVANETELESPKGLKGQYALADLGIAKDLIITKLDRFNQQANHPATLYFKIKNEGIKIY
ncbi:MAG: nucleotidyltransferase domain-containing protein [Cytophagales bacterium]|nr:nucleotidyltransferase domain-containing protein [Cytophagales bacterium]